ncbi:DUF1642 domain-containing protein [Listeria seeligeri]|uniref:DUF1642 domain-containing protein n=1 Tax=Listeria seeligeri TaxID=1640 RepID=UPI001889B9C0|nr:DUF1642 domain-containing protein [Listeria seeligeri]MBF2653943.1 DUF1642 domain-containing protein [Listeria seeligeri]
MKKTTKEYVKGVQGNNELTVISPPTVPECVAKWFEENKRDLEYSIWEYIYDFGENGENSNDFFSFMNNTDNKPIRTLILMKYGYYVEKEVEKRYIVNLPHTLEDWPFLFFLQKIDSGIRIVNCPNYPENAPSYGLTEAEIRGVWDGYMELAKEVE